MTAAFTSFFDPAMAPAFGAAGLAAQLAGPLYRRRQTMLTLQLTAACAYATSYALLGQSTATAVCVSGAIQTSVALIAGDRPWLKGIGYAFLPGVVAIGALTFSGLPTILAVTACCLVMIGRLQRDPLRMRGVQLAASPIGAAHDAAVGAWPSLAGALLTFTVAGMAFRRELRARRGAAVPA